MSSEHNTAPASGEQPVHKDVTFESSDINTRTILLYLVYLAVAVGAAFLVTVFIFRGTSRMAANSETPMAPVHKGVAPTMPPEPRLQGVPGHPDDPQQDLRDKIATDQKANETLGWVDRSAGIAQIPVDDAMKIIVSKGLGSSSSAPAAEKKK